MRLFTIILLGLTLNLVSLHIASAQGIDQSVKGRITDEVTGAELPRAFIKIFGEGKTFESNADDAGFFRISVPAGLYRFTVSNTGYAPVDRELLVISGRESVVNISLKQSARELKEVEVSSSYLDEIPGQRSLSIEKTLRVPANFFDPVRVATAYPGVIAANDQANSIIVRGNSPNGLLWRLNGLDIVNPNHLANAGTLSDKPTSNGGGVNILSAQMLDRTDFYMGAFPTNYGNALAGIIDMNLREGNKNEFEYTAQASLIGMDFSAEGPLGKSENTSFLVNYRYSTVGLLSLMGLDFGGEVISFQDLSFNLNSDFKKGGKLTLFGFGGNSKNEFTKKPSDEWLEDKDKYDIDYKSGNYAIGLNYSVPFHRGKMFVGLAYSGSLQTRNAIASDEVDPTERHLIFDDYDTNNKLFSSSLRYETMLGQKGTMELGAMANGIDNSVKFIRETGCLVCSVVTRQQLDGSNDGILLQPFANFGYAFSKAVSVKAGVRYLTYTFNNTYSLEPRVGLNVKPSDKVTVDLSYGIVSQIQSPQVYSVQGNEDLGFTKSHHFDLGYSRTFSDGLALKTGLFYQYLFDVPVGGSSSSFSVLNLLEGFGPNNLYNGGTGENYGVDVTLEKYFFNKNYFLIGGSYYDSKYTGANGFKRNTRFNGNFTFSTVYGKEWTRPDKNRTIGLNARALYLGGLRQLPVNISSSQANAETVYDVNANDPYAEKMADYFRLDLRVSFRKNKPRYTRTFAIDIQNLTSQQNEAYQYYDFTQQKLVTKFQLGIIPVLVYRIDF
jgi:hypothetical protein